MRTRRELLKRYIVECATAEVKCLQIGDRDGWQRVRNLRDQAEVELLHVR